MMEAAIKVQEMEMTMMLLVCKYHLLHYSTLTICVDLYYVINYTLYYRLVNELVAMQKARAEKKKACQMQVN